MAKREQARADAAFARGDLGVDGLATEAEQRDAAEVERDRAREQLLRGGTALGRELLTWLLWRSESTEPVTELDGAAVSVVFSGRVVLRGVAGDVTELAARGALAPYAPDVRSALAHGLLVHQARLRIEHAERAYEATLDAEFLDVRTAKLPELLKEADDDRRLERLELAERLSEIVDTLVRAFLAVRTGRGWRRTVVPQLRAWMEQES
jgi:hypothetical protein